MKKYGAGEFKAKCLGILDDVVREQQAVYITKRGKLVAALVPPPSETEDLVAGLKGSILFEKDIITPIDEGWEADQ
jgi:prevent-host-death family protein